MGMESFEPYEELFVYYFKGRLKPDSAISDDAFIGNWEEEDNSFLFFTRSSSLIVKALLAEQPQLRLLDEFHMSYDEWHGESVAPIQIGRFRVSPPWAKQSACAFGMPDNRGMPPIDILLDPGVVFGTGTHPTTQHCLEAIEKVMSLESPETLLDLGTGTGLLAIAAVKLGCKHALAVDLNLLAAATAKKNIEINGLGQRILAVQGEAENFVDFPSDLMISNLHYDVMKQIIAHSRFLYHRYFILSGLLRSQKKYVEDVLMRYPVELLQTWDHNGIWYSFLGKTEHAP